MWGQHWGEMIWGQGVSVPVLGFGKWRFSRSCSGRSRSDALYLLR